MREPTGPMGEHDDEKAGYGNCGALSASGDECDLYVHGWPHGGQMHSGVRDGYRIWWSKATGRVVHFSTADEVTR